MADNKRVVIIGGHGKVALLAAPKFRDAGYSVDSIIRNPDQKSDIEERGANPVLLDIEKATVDELREAFQGAAAAVTRSAPTRWITRPRCVPSTPQSRRASSVT